MSSTVYASYLSSHSDNPYHINHIYEFRELATMIAKEQIEMYLPRIENMVNNAVNRAMSSAITQATNGMDIDINKAMKDCEGIEKVQERTNTGVVSYYK